MSGGGRAVAEISAQAVKALRDRTGAGMMECKKALGDAAGDVERAIALLRERGLAKAVKRAGRATSEGTIALASSGAAAAILELGCETDFVAKTDDFQAVANALARAALAHPEAKTPADLLDLAEGGRTLGESVQAASGKLGENVELKRVAHLALAGGGRTGGYLHAGGRLGVIVALESGAGAEGLDALAKDLAMHVAAHDPSPVSIDREGVPKELLAHEAELFRRRAEQEGKPAPVIERIVTGRLEKFYSEVCLLEQAFVKDPDKKVKRLLEEAGQRLGRPVRVTGYVRFKLGETATE
jgi:elongation factor Ts